MTVITVFATIFFPLIMGNGDPVSILFAILFMNTKH